MVQFRYEHVLIAVPILVLSFLCLLAVIATLRTPKWSTYDKGIWVFAILFLPVLGLALWWIAWRRRPRRPVTY